MGANCEKDRDGTPDGDESRNEKEKIQSNLRNTITVKRRNDFNASE